MARQPQPPHVRPGRPYPHAKGPVASTSFERSALYESA